MTVTPTRISYVNGRYVRHNEAAVHIEDRGYQFADGVYEAILMENHVLIDGKQHWTRLKRSLKELSIAMPCSVNTIESIIQELFRRNRMKSGTRLEVRILKAHQPS